MTNLFDLSGRVALITGGNGGIGLAIAKALASAGADILIAGRNAEKNVAAAAQVAELDVRVETLQVDVTNEAACQAMVATTIASLGRLDILVNNAGISLAGRPESLSLERFRAVLDTNLTSTFVCAQAAYPAMKAQGSGKVINIGSMYSLFGGPFVPAYAASKGAVVQLTKSQATAWAADNIQVNAILPGWIDTDMSRRARSRSPEFEAAITARTPAGRWGDPDDLAGAAIFLSSDASNFINGASIAVDGGYSVSG